MIYNAPIQSLKMLFTTLFCIPAVSNLYVSLARLTSWSKRPLIRVILSITISNGFVQEKGQLNFFKHSRDSKSFMVLWDKYSDINLYPEMKCTSIQPVRSSFSTAFWCVSTLNDSSLMSFSTDSYALCGFLESSSFSSFLAKLCS